MKYATSRTKATRQTENTSPRDSSTGQEAISIAPPEYGIGFVDQGMADTAPVQTKLNINAPGDKYEIEADRVAEEVVRLPGVPRTDRGGQLQRACACGKGEEDTLRRSPIKLPHITSLDQRTVARLRFSDLVDSEPLQGPDVEIFPEEKGVLQSKSAPGSGVQGHTESDPSVVPTDLESTITRMSGSGGEPLSAPTRAFLEPRFGHDFSPVRIHSDRPSGEIARQLNAHAFTLGNHIFFSSGQYQPDHLRGQKLLAHELTHVVQQGASGGPVQQKQGQVRRTVTENEGKVVQRNGGEALKYGVGGALAGAAVGAGVGALVGSIVPGAGTAAGAGVGAVIGGVAGGLAGAITGALTSSNPCPPYNGWDTSKNVETFNCAGLAHRTYDYKGLAATQTALNAGQSVACGTACNAGQVKHWLWQYDLHAEDHNGNQLTAPAPDFHTVAGVAVGNPSQDPTDVYSKNGKRPVYGPGTGPGFRPPARAQARENNAGERLATDRNGNPIYKVRTNYRDSCYCLPCPV